MHNHLAFPAGIRATLARTGKCLSNILPLMGTMFAVAIATTSLLSSPAAADVVYGTSGSNIVSYDTQTNATTTTVTNLYPQSYGIAYSPNDGNLYIVDRIPGVNLEKIEVYSTGGTDLGTFATNLPYGGSIRGDAVTFDKSGNLYLGTRDLSGRSAVQEFFVGGGSTYLPGPVGSLSFLYQLNVDNSNNLFVTDLGNNNVYEYGPARTTPSLFTTQSPSVSGVAADSAGNVYVGTFNGPNVYRYGPGGGAPTANPYSNQGALGLVYSPATHSLFGVSPPSLYQIDLNNGNPSTNFTQVSSTFFGTEFITIQVVPEPSTIVLVGSVLSMLIAHRVLRRRR